MAKLWLLMCYTEEVGVKIIEITGNMSTGVTTPGVGFGVEPTVEKVQCLVGIHYVTVVAGVP